MDRPRRALRQQLLALRWRAAASPADALAELDALGLGEDAPPDLRVLAAAVRCRAELQRGELPAALAAATRAERLAAEAAPGAMGHAQLAVAQVFAQLGHGAAALEAYERAIGLLADEAPLAFGARLEHAAQLRAAGRLPDAVRAFDLLLADADEVEVNLRAVLGINAASAYHQVGRLADARRALALADRVLDRAGRPDLRPWWQAIAAWVEAAAGDGEAAARHAREALAVEDPATLPVRASAARALAAAGRLGVPGATAEAEALLEALAPALADRGLLALAAQARQDLADLATARGDLVATVRHLRAGEAISARRREEGLVLRMQAEDLRLELMRRRHETERLRAEASTLAEANRALAELDLARKRLLRTVAHDLRNPLILFLAFADLLDDARDPERLASIRAELAQTAERMRTLLDRALSDAAIESGMVELVREPVDLGAALRSLVRSFEPLARARGTALAVEGSPTVRATVDPIAFGRIVDNLVGNALKYGAPGGRVVVRAEEDEAEVRLAVEDDGPGFGAAEPARALVLGQRLGHPDPDGHGVGLHAVYELVTRHGGVVEVGARPGGGARVLVRLPRAGAAAP